MTRHLEVEAAVSADAIRSLNAGLSALQDALRHLITEGPPADIHRPSPVFSEAMSRWWRAYDRYVALVSEALEVRCGGCHFCCRDNPRGLSGVELLWAWRASLGLPDHPAIAARTATLAADWRADVEALGEDAAADAVSRGGAWCMYLSPEGRCRIYAARPIPCRMFLSITEPAWCDHSHPDHDRAVNPHAEPAEILRKLLGAISERLGLGDLPADLRSGVAALEQREALSITPP